MNEEGKRRIKENLETKNPELDLSNCEITGEEKELDLLKNASHLQTLFLHSNQIENISFLKNLQQLKQLSLYSNPIRNYCSITILQQLDILYLGLEYKEQDYLAIAELSQLKHLSMVRCFIKDSSFFNELRNLEQLNLHSSCLLDNVTDVSFLKGLKELQELNLERNFYIRNISNLAELTKLTKLNLRTIHRVKDYSPIMELKQLEQLDIGQNLIESFTFLKSLKNLTELKIGMGYSPDYPPISIALLIANGGKLDNYLHLNELSKVEKIPPVQNLVITILACALPLS